MFFNGRIVECGRPFYTSSEKSFADSKDSKSPLSVLLFLPFIEAKLENNLHTRK